MESSCRGHSSHQDEFNEQETKTTAGEIKVNISANVEIC